MKLPRLYWRRAPASKVWHAWARGPDRRFHSLCALLAVDGPIGQDLRRPVVALRCVGCDRAERDRRGLTKPAPATYSSART